MGGELIQSQATKIKLGMGNAFVYSYWGAWEGPESGVERLVLAGPYVTKCIGRYKL